MKCMCHSLFTLYASEKLPNDVEDDLVSEIYTYSKFSFKHQPEFKEFHIFIKNKSQKLLQPSQTI